MQGVGEAPRHARRARPAGPLPERHHDELRIAPFTTADEDERTVVEIVHVERPARRGRAGWRLVGRAPGRDCGAHAPRDLRPRVQRSAAPADPLAIALDRVVGDGDQHLRPVASLGQPPALAVQLEAAIECR